MPSAPTSVDASEAVAEQTAFYLKPVGLLTGVAAANACAQGLAAKLAGGPVAFNAAEVIRRDGATRAVTAPVASARMPIFRQRSRSGCASSRRRGPPSPA